jgi:hypothetical protein
MRKRCGSSDQINEGLLALQNRVPRQGRILAFWAGLWATSRSPLQERIFRDCSKKDRPPNPCNPVCSGAHYFDHDALVPGPGNAEHFSLAFTTGRKVKGAS